MKNKMLNPKKYPPKCEYCKSGRLSPDGESILCERKGIVSGEDVCRAYKYDVLKRMPKKKPKISAADPDDFTL